MLNKVQKSFSEKLPFIIYAKPLSKQVNGLFQRDNKLNYFHDFCQKGFVLAPFDDSPKAILIPFDEAEFIQEVWDEDLAFETPLIENSYSEWDKVSFEEFVKKIISEIEKGEISKIVASRKEDFFPTDFEITTLFKKMLYNYPTAFRYCFYHPEIGMWMGATPEKLLSVQDNVLQTMAYAGTQKFRSETEVVWGEKEKQEQQFVTDFIVKNLESESDEIQLSQPFTSRAGTLLHIRTDIQATLKEDFSLEKIIKKLHPTPAVCGSPKDLAKEFILQNEGYNRSFYAGFLGEINFGENKTAELYVNLRCIEIQNQKVSFYMGCGITKDSNPENEFLETVNKSVTMKSLF